MNPWLTLIGIGLFIVGVIFIVRFFKKRGNKNKRDFIENQEFRSKKYDGSAELYLFTVEWCPHCKDTIEKWKNFKKGYVSDKYQITFVEVDCEEKENLANEYKIEEYPTIVLVRNNNKYYYDANIKEETLNKFINTIMEL